MTCPLCTEVFQDNAAWCGRCGRRLRPDDQGASVAATRRPRWLAACLLTAALLLVGSVIVYSVQFGAQETPQAVDQVATGSASQAVPTTPKRDPLVGRWKAVAANDNSTVEFYDDNSFSFPGVADDGAYARANDNEVKLEFTAGGVAKQISWRIKLSGDVLLTIDMRGQNSKWRRTAAPILEVNATAPQTLSTLDIGRPCDANFNRISGTEGAQLYKPQQGVTGGSRQGGVDFLEAVDVDTLKANADGWGIAHASVEQNAQRRYLVERAWQQVDVLRVDDTTEMLHAPPAEASWYVAAIYVGRSYELIMSGAKGTFHAGIAARLKVFGGSIDAFTEKTNLQWKVRLRGVESSNDRAIFAKTPDEIMHAYKQADPVPIWVIYRSIPYRKMRVTEKLEWADEPVPDDVEVEEDPVRCKCAEAPEPVQVDAVCRVRNLSARSMDVALAVHAVTGTTGNRADQVTRVTLAPKQSADVPLEAPVQTSWNYHCDSLASCACELRRKSPSDLQRGD